MSGKSTSHQDKVNTTSHLIETAGHHLAHTHRHVIQLEKSKGKKERDFNLDHIKTHLSGGLEHLAKLKSHIATNYPSEARELFKLESTIPHAERSSHNMAQRVKKTLRNKRR